MILTMHGINSLPTSGGGTEHEVQIGTIYANNTKYYIPWDGNNSYSLTQQIYKAKEIQTAGTITDLSYYCFIGYLSWNVVIYMSHITKSILAFNSEQLTNNEYVKDTVKVFDGVVRLTESNEKWVKIPLSTQFAYNGTNNLLITVCENTPSNVSKELQFATSNISATLTTHIANQNTAYDPVNSIYSMTMDDKKRNVIKLNMLV